MNPTLEESTTDNISPILTNLIIKVLSEVKCKDSIQKDAMFMLMVVSMMENGFCILDASMEPIDILKLTDLEQLDKLKLQSGVFEASFVYSSIKSITLKLFMSPLGATALANVVITELDTETYAVCLPISRYVVSPTASTIPLIFRDLNHFSKIFKDKIISVVKSRILTYCGYASASLIGLPEEIILKIMLYLRVYDVVNVSKTCKTLKNVVASNNLWYFMSRRDFKVLVSFYANEDKDWKELYQESFKLKTAMYRRKNYTMPISFQGELQLMYSLVGLRRYMYPWNYNFSNL